MAISSRGEAVYDVLRLVRPLYLHSARAVAATLENSSLTVGSRAVLELIHDGGAQPVPALARSLGVARQGVQRVVDALLVDGYVVRRPNPGHARSKLIALTASGEQAYRRLHDQELAVLAELAVDVDPEDLRNCRDVLARILAGVRAQADRAGAPDEEDPSVGAIDEGR